MDNASSNPYHSDNTGHRGRMSNPDGRPCATYHPETMRAVKRLRFLTGGAAVTACYQTIAWIQRERNLAIHARIA